MIHNERPGISQAWDNLCSLTEERNQRIFDYLFTHTVYKEQKNKTGIIHDILEDLTENTNKDANQLLQEIYIETMTDLEAAEYIKSIMGDSVQIVKKD